MKYDGLRQHLQARAQSPWRARFSEVEALPGGLPPSAYNHAAWWSNSQSHPEAVAWLAAGWRTEAVNLTSRTVTFVRSS
ncbi:DUF7662 domain-containing protein [Microlunatus ginsengisoli]|uniref:DUF7662 domain-containing protein n=1 Tax=Microlunatus ginsengisoli TaxID=363863 RepID=A0ABP6ZDS5_9ACTN